MTELHEIQATLIIVEDQLRSLATKREITEAEIAKLSYVIQTIILIRGKLADYPAEKNNVAAN